MKRGKMWTPTPTGQEQFVPITQATAVYMDEAENKTLSEAMIELANGVTGPVGPQGVKGDTGPQGIQGPKGDPGSNAWGDITGKPESMPSSDVPDWAKQTGATGLQLPGPIYTNEGRGLTENYDGTSTIYIDTDNYNALRIKTGLDATRSYQLYAEIKGNTVGSGRGPIFTIINIYYDIATNSLMAAKQINAGTDLAVGMVTLYNGIIYIWMPITGGYPRLQVSMWSGGNRIKIPEVAAIIGVAPFPGSPAITLTKF